MRLTQIVSKHRKTSVFILAALLLFYPLIDKIGIISTKKEATMIRCPQCGARKNRATDPCIYCGADAERKPRAKIKLLLLIILAITLIATCVLILAGSIANGNSAEELVDTWIDAINENDASKLSTVFPEIYLGGTNMIPDFAADYLDGYREDLEAEYGDDFHMSAVIQDTMSMDGSDEDLLAEIYEEADIKVTQGKHLEIELTVKGSKKAETQTLTINIIKVNGEWYFDVLDPYFF